MYKLQIIDDQKLTGLATNSKKINLNFVIKIVWGREKDIFYIAGSGCS